MSENIKALNHCIGFGNPSANYWFISIEDGGGYYKENEYAEIEHKSKERELERLELYKRKYRANEYSEYHLTNEDLKDFYLKYPNEKEMIIQDYTYNNYCTIYNHFNDDKITPENIGESNLNLFISNLFPISRKMVNSEYDKFVKEFVFDGSFSDWQEIYWEERLNSISSFFQKNIKRNNSVTLLCFGASVNFEFNRLVNKLCGQEIKLTFNEKITFNHFTILNTYHPGRINTYNKKFNTEEVIKLLSD